MDAVIKCCDRDPDPPCVVESDKVTFLALTLPNYLLGISKCSILSGSHSRRLILCSGVMLTGVSVGRADHHRGDFFSIQVARDSNYNNKSGKVATAGAAWHAAGERRCFSGGNVTKAA